MQVVLASWRPRVDGHDVDALRAAVLAGLAPSDRVGHVRVEDGPDEWRIAFFVDAATGDEAHRRVEEILRRTSAVLPVGPSVLDVQVVTEWFRPRR